jgi:TM2 domain-containing membrane protein YozV
MMAIVVKKVDSEAQTVTLLSDGVLSEAPFDQFLTVPQVEQQVTLQQTANGESKYVVFTPADMQAMGEQSTKSKLVAGLLGIFLGYFGVHNFYIGRTGRAVTQLLFSTVGWITFGILPTIAAVWGFVEGILILVSQPGTSFHQDGMGRELQD